MLVGLGHKSRVGKDTVGEHLANEHGFERASFAAKLYVITEAIQKILDKPIGKDPGLLQTIGTALRNHYGEDVFIDALFKELSQERMSLADVVITDVRYKNEFNRVRDEGGILIDIHRPDRPIDRDPNHASEVELDGVDWDHVVVNDKTPDDLCKSVVDILHDESV